MAGTMHIRDWFHHLPERHAVQSLGHFLHDQRVWIIAGLLALMALVMVLGASSGASESPEMPYYNPIAPYYFPLP